MLKKAAFIILLVLIADQVFKIWVKTHMTIGQEIPVIGNWFIIHFTENEGMAFGMRFGGNFGKLFLSIFRIFAVIIIGGYLIRLTKKKEKTGLILSLSLIFAGALGNIIDSAFYGMIFSESKFHEVAILFPSEGGYSSFLHGKVVDMLYFPVIKGYYPTWFPFWGGNDFIFFRPVFNIADSSITIGVFILIIFQKKFFKKENKEIREIE
ncbi:MAG: lipoprotein signal peptidase [Bacteroidales bacterium]|nr:lipoprotein signal peptidase [Bacteroidales bacterium]